MCQAREVFQESKKALSGNSIPKETQIEFYSSILHIYNILYYYIFEYDIFYSIFIVLLYSIQFFWCILFDVLCFLATVFNSCAQEERASRLKSFLKRLEQDRYGPVLVNNEPGRCRWTFTHFYKWNSGLTPSSKCETRHEATFGVFFGPWSLYSISACYFILCKNVVFKVWKCRLHRFEGPGRAWPAVTWPD